MCSHIHNFGGSPGWGGKGHTVLRYHGVHVPHHFHPAEMGDHVVVLLCQWLPTSGIGICQEA